MTTSTVTADEALERPSRAHSSALHRLAPLWAPLLILAILAGPSVTFLLPATQDYLDEIYQPLQALKFFKSKGKAYHKYGPAPNFILAPGYAASLAYWKVTGSFNKPSEDFPYGFKRPFQQMGFMIFQARALFLVIGLVGFAALAHALGRATGRPWAVGLALLFTLATNYAVAIALPTPRPDSAMLGFAALALASYVNILFRGLTAWRAAWMSLLAVVAISSKELAGPMFVLPYLGLIALAWREGDAQPGGGGRATTAVIYSVATGVVAYCLLNIVYAPATWLQRMRFWIGGPGIDAEVWGGGGLRAQVVGTLECLLNNLGPGGAIVTITGGIALLVLRPRRWVMLILPAVSVFALGLARIQYPADRFYTIFCLALFPVVACGLAAMIGAAGFARLRPIAAGAFVLLAIVNAWWATFSWHAPRGTFEYVSERHAQAHVAKDRQRVALFNTFPWNKGSTRLDHLGFKVDPRSIQQVAARPADRPDWLYSTQGKSMFLEHAKSMPARAQLIKKESGFDVSNWRGVEGIGYALAETIVPSTPGWFAFDWMPAVKEWKQRRAVQVFRRAG